MLYYQSQTLVYPFLAMQMLFVREKDYSVETLPAHVKLHSLKEMGLTALASRKIILACIV